MPGPPPKRSEYRRRPNSPEPDRVGMDGSSVEMPEPDEHWHPLAKDWYLALRESGQSLFYEPSDWQQARFVAELMTKIMAEGKTNANLVTAILSAGTDLGVTEGARRRMRVEIDRAASTADDEAAKLMSEYGDDS